jgi:probable phosphoglycerate mutase
VTVHELWLARHGETEWTLSRQHTSVTDLDLTDSGVEQSRALGRRLAGRQFAVVLSSPALRARRTAELGGFEPQLEPDFTEFRYGEYEGVTTAEIKRERPDWDLWRDGCPGGEQTAEVAARADRVIERLRAAGGPALVFGHGHMSRVLSARWLGLDGTGGRFLMMSTATLSIIGVEHGQPAIRLWNDASHLDMAAPEPEPPAG